MENNTNNNSVMFLGLIIIIVIIVGIIFGHRNTPTSALPTTALPTTTPLFSDVAAPLIGADKPTHAQSATATPTRPDDTIIYTKNGFEPFVMEVKPGTVIHFVNRSDGAMVIKSFEDPADFYPGFSQESGPLGKNGVYSFTFLNSGAWVYRNLANPKDRGVVVVK